jgi:hypothetical protein
MKPTKIPYEFGLSLTTICDALRSLRQLDLVRYETRRDGKFYFIKDEMILSAMREIERLVKRIQTKEY